MTRLLQWFLGIDRIRLGEGGRVVFDFLSAWPGWAVFLAVVITAVYVWSIYRRENPATPPVARGLLMLLRCSLILLALGMIFEPALRLERDDQIRSTVAVMVDRSASMTVADWQTFEQETKLDVEVPTVAEMLRRGGVAPARDGEPTRFELARAALALDVSEPGAVGNALKRLAAEQRIYLYVFDEAPQLVKRIDSADDVEAALSELAAVTPNGKRTMIPQSVEKVLEQLSGQTLTGLVLVTDGRDTVSADTRKIEETLGDVPLVCVGLGSVTAPNDAELLRATAERRAFVNEELPVRVELRNTGYEGRGSELELTVTGHPEMTVTKAVTFGPESVAQTVEMHLKPQEAGTFTLQVTLKPTNGESDRENNASLPIEIDVLDRKLKVLIVEDLPRWEYQYLKNALYRDPTVLTSILLKSADVHFAPEGDLPIGAFPESRDKLFEYDVIVLGDVDCRTFSAEQLGWIDEFVRVKGGGLVMIAGNRGYNPNSYVGSPIEALLPVETSDEQLIGQVGNEFRPERTIEGSVSPILRFEKDMDENRKTWEDLPGFYWYYRARGVKPGTQVLLEHPDQTSPYTGDKLPIMVLQRVGAGQVFFSCSDETWRWRWYTGRRYFNNFWLQLVRYLALPQQRAVIETENLRYTLGEKAKIQLRVTDPSSVGPQVQRVAATVRWQTPEQAPAEQQVVLGRTSPALAFFEGEFTPEVTGKFVMAAEVSTGKDTVRAEGDFLVTPSREEFRQPTRDAALLAKLSGLNGRGQVLAPHQTDRLPDLILAQTRTVDNDLVDEIWDSPGLLIVFVLLITLEWVLRKRHRML
ncbi:MAG: hypothetical protein JXL80_16440 [Planctomycetes bacterium]|nr:hypothetical protein [Planctomycetota bacterium]